MKNISIMTLLSLLMLVFVGCGAQAASDEKTNTPNTEHGGDSSNENTSASDELSEPRVVILSMDAFRHDLPVLYDTPTLDSIARVGVYSEIMPCFPSNTFPNHYSMATGLHPDHHGIVNNTFYDEVQRKSYAISDAEAKANAEFYKGEPIWNTVERQGLIAHVYGWVGIDAAVNGHKPTVAMQYVVMIIQRRIIGVQRRQDTLDGEAAAHGPVVIVAGLEGS